MPVALDPYDIDDDIFANPDALDALEAHALQSTQAPSIFTSQRPAKARITQPYHHQIVRPSPTFSGRKEPAPLNTEPRTSNCGFGWEYGGKRSIEGNVERHVAAISERAAYWSHGNGRGEEDYPDIVIGEDGTYELGNEMDGEVEVVDNHARTGVELARPALSQNQSIDLKGAAARREAIAAAANAVIDSPPRASLLRSNSASSFIVNPQKDSIKPDLAGQSQLQPRPQLQPAERSLLRSASVGSHQLSHSTLRVDPLPAIVSQSSQSSQGSSARRAAMELAEERQRREAVESQLQSLRNQISVEQRKEKEKEQERSVDSAKPDEDLENRLKTLQADLWRARGETETMRRAQKDVRRLPVLRPA